MEEKSVLEQIVALKDEGKFGLISYRLLFLSAISSATSFGVITQREVLERMKDKNIKIFFTNFEDYKVSKNGAYKLYIGLRDRSRYSDCKLFRYHGGSWEHLETEFSEEVKILKGIGFKINYKGYVE